jgi:hypothetical protein
MSFIALTNGLEERQVLWEAALKEIGRRLRRELQPKQPNRMRELIAQLEAHAPGKGDE